ncbi:hypothetical protein C6P40_002506 [Pichia californica]|uniref:Trafficking protein particle complex subunit 11 domain-containing protein n=1 Tax=Pichia californica TaxID=460514 RepID=A0A9P6WHM9_9ASCO|nr:hypothetical protein C6P40_002506 [[Candida] californica]
MISNSFQDKQDKDLFFDISIPKQRVLDTMVSAEIRDAALEEPIVLNVGFYDPFSIFQGGFRSDFEKFVRLPSFYWKDNHDYLRVLKNVNFKFSEEIPHSKKNTDISYLRLMFISCQSIEDYRAKVRPLILQWLESIRLTDPKIPYFIFFFENTELRTTADKYLKTNLFNKVKLDFDHKEFVVDNIFKIKSIYQSSTDKTECWKLINTSVKTLLSSSINLQLSSYKDDFIKTARVFQGLNQKQDALSCYSKLFNSYPFIKRQDFDLVSLKEIEDIFNGNTQISISNVSSKFLCKFQYYKYQETILLAPHLADIVYMKNICRLAQTLLSFLNSLEMCFKRNEISFLLINMFLNNSQLKKILDKHISTNDELINCIGNLKLLQRNELVALGISKDYYVKGSMSIIDVQFSNIKYTIMDNNLNQILSSEKVFIDKIIELTRELIELYNQSSFSLNKVASLSTELALIMYYSSDDYESSYDQLFKSYDFFFSNSWKYIGVALLEVYIENLDKLIGVHGIDVVYQLLSSYVTLAVNKSSKFDDEKFKSLCSQLEKNVTYKTKDMLEILNISSVYCDNVDIYKIDIKFKSKLFSKVDKIKLSMRNRNNETIQFFCDDVKIKNSNTLTLSCYKLSFDTFKATNISMIVGKFEIIQPLNNTIHITSIDSFYDPETNAMKHNTKAYIRVPPVRYLHSDRLLFEAKVGSNNISTIEFVFMKTDPDKLVTDAECEMYLKTSNSEITELDFEIKELEKKVIFFIKDSTIFNFGDTVSLYIPYFFPPDVSNTILDLSYSFHFKSIYDDDNQFLCSQKYTSQIESSLPLAVSTDEIFRSSYSSDITEQVKPSFSLLSQYSINSVSGDNPVRVQSVVLSSKKSTVETWKSPKNLVAFVDQGSSFFFKVSDFADNDVLLTISYNSVKNEIVEFLNLKFTEYLKEKESLSINKRDFFAFISAAYKIWENLPYKLNFYALTNKVFLLDFTLLIIERYIKYIDKRKQVYFKDHVQKFIESLSTLEMNEELKESILLDIKQELCIVVSLPTINMVNVVEYQFDKVLQYLVCEPIDVKLTLDVHMLGYTSNEIEEFDTTITSEKHVRFKTKEDGEETILERSLPEFINLDLVFNDYDQKWIISGVKNLEAKIDVKEAIKNNGMRFQYDLTFVPLKPGKLQLPGIEVKNQSTKDLMMELDYKNTAESLLIVSELNKIIHSF